MKSFLLVLGMMVCASAQAQQLDPSHTFDPKTVVATQGTASVTFEDIDARAAPIDPEARAGVFDSPKRIQTMVSGLLVNRQLADEARKLGLDKDAQTQLEIRLAADAILARRRVEHFAREEFSFDAEATAREVYTADPKKYATPESRVVRHILLETEKQGDIAARAKLAEAEKALAAGEKFEEVAKRLSDDRTTAAQGGLLPQFGRGIMQPAFEEAAFALAKPGDRSAATVQTSFGYHVIELVSVEPARDRTFAEVHDEIVANLKTTQAKRAADEHVTKLRNLPIEANEQAVASLRTRYGVSDEARAREQDAAARQSATN